MQSKMEKLFHKIGKARAVILEIDGDTVGNHPQKPIQDFSSLFR